MAVVTGVLIPLFFQDKPNSPPSHSEALKRQKTPTDLLTDAKGLLHDTGFIFAVLATSLFIAYIVDCSKGLANIIYLGDVTIKDLEGITLFFYVPGLFSVMLPALYLGRGIMMYRSVFLIIMLMSFVALGVLVIAIAYAKESMGFLYTVTVINGFITNACMPLCYEIPAETAFPKSEALTAGLVHFLYAGIRIILKAMNRWLDDTESGIESFAYCFVLIVLVFLSFVFMFFARIKHRRLKIELKMA